MTQMTSLERCRTVLEGGIPDRVPVCLENFMHAASVAGHTVREYCKDGEKMAAAHIATWEKYRHDMTLNTCQKAAGLFLAPVVRYPIRHQMTTLWP